MPSQTVKYAGKEAEWSPLKRGDLGQAQARGDGRFDVLFTIPKGPRASRNTPVKIVLEAHEIEIIAERMRKHEPTYLRPGQGPEA